jgi:hypothetical protein
VTEDATVTLIAAYVPPMPLDDIPPGRLTGPRAAYARQAVADAYRDGATIRQIAADTNRSYGWVHRALEKAHVERRPRGQTRRGN